MMRIMIKSGMRDDTKTISVFDDVYLDGIIDSGALLDFSQFARESGLECRTFVTPSLWSNKLRSDADELKKIFRLAPRHTLHRIVRRQFGRDVRHIILPKLETVVSVAYHVCPSRRFGIVIVAMASKEELDVMAWASPVDRSLYLQ